MKVNNDQLRAHWEQQHRSYLRKKRRELLLAKEANTKPAPPRSHYKVIQKWVRDNDFVWYSRHWGSGSIWRGNNMLALVNFQGRGRHVLGWVQPTMEIDFPLPKGDYLGYRVSLKQGIEILKQAKKVFENPSLAPKPEVPRKPREKFVPVFPKLKYERQRSKHDDL